MDTDGRLHFSSVELSDGKATLVYECAATSPVLRGEYRSGDRIQLDIEPTQGEFHLLFIHENFNFQTNLIRSESCQLVQVK